MRNILVKIPNHALHLFILACCAFTVCGVAAQDDKAINVATYNLRYNNPSDGANAWPLRKDAVKALIRFHSFDLFGTQEGLDDQIQGLAEMGEFSHIGVGRDDGKHAGEHSAIFYRTNRFELLQHGDFWLSQTPDKPSLGWDAQCCKRIASWAQLHDLQTKKSFYVFSVHFDHQGVVARRESAKLMLSKIRELVGKAPVICLGDFNSTPDTEQIVTMRGALRDSQQISATPAYGPTATFNGFQWGEVPKERIDYIFVSEQIKVLKYGVLSDSINQNYPSDHFPVMAQLVVE